MVVAVTEFELSGDWLCAALDSFAFVGVVISDAASPMTIKTTPKLNVRLADRKKFGTR